MTTHRALAASPSTATSSPMRTSSRSTPRRVFSLWLTLVPTRELFVQWDPSNFTKIMAYSNGSQFFVTTVPTSWLDGKHVVFGEVADADSMKVVKAIEATGSSSGSPRDGKKKPPVIASAGQY